MNLSTGNLFLVGLMGAGKSTVGRQLAMKLSKTFIDCDQWIEQHCGVPVSLIFEVEGEPGFRRRETEALQVLSQQRGCVIATGGGAVLAAENRQLIADSGFCVYLAAAVDDLYARTRHDRSRPLLRTADPRATLAALLAIRDPLYRGVADLVIETGRPPVGKLAQMILDRLPLSVTAGQPA